MFAFASSDGVKLLLKDDVFKKFAGAHKFELIVGIDDNYERQSIAGAQGNK